MKRFRTNWALHERWFQNGREDLEQYSCPVPGTRAAAVDGIDAYYVYRDAVANTDVLHSDAAIQRATAECSRRFDVFLKRVRSARRRLRPRRLSPCRRCAFSAASATSCGSEEKAYNIRDGSIKFMSGAQSSSCCNSSDSDSLLRLSRLSCKRLKLNCTLQELKSQ